jgi:hypothetical protein
VESNLGYLEFELCNMLHITPKELGVKRQQDPLGIMFLERHFIHRWNEKVKAMKKQESELKKRKHR